MKFLTGPLVSNIFHFTIHICVFITPKPCNEYLFINFLYHLIPVVLEQPAKTVGSQVTTEFSDEDLEISNFETDRNDRPSGSGSSVRQWQERLWTSLLNAKDKGRKQVIRRGGWVKGVGK